MIKLIKTILKIIVAILVVGLLIWGLSCTNFGRVSDFAKDVRGTVEEYFGDDIDAASQVVKEQAKKIAQSIDWSADDVEAFLEKYDLAGLEPTTLPADAVERKTVTKQFLGESVNLILYEDRSYITMVTEDSSVTLSVPEDKQRYVALLG